MHLIKVKYPTLSAFKESRFVEKEDPQYVPEVLPSHLGVEVPASPARSAIACSEFSLEFENHEDILIASSPPTTSMLSASAPSFYPLGPSRGVLSATSSLGYIRVRIITHATDGNVTLQFTVDGKPVGASTPPQPVKRSSSAASSWSAARTARRTSGTGTAFSGSVPGDNSFGAEAMFGRSPPFGSGRAITAARPVGQPWKSGRGNSRRGPGSRNDASSQELGTSLGASPSVATPIGMSPVAFSSMNSVRGGTRNGGRPGPRGGHPSSGEHISVWPSNWNHKGRDGQRKHGGKGGAGSNSSSWVLQSRWGGRENESNNPNHRRGSALANGSGINVSSERSSGSASCIVGGFSGADLVTGPKAVEIEGAEFERKSPNDESDASLMTDCSGYAHDEGGPIVSDSVREKRSGQVRCMFGSAAALVGITADFGNSFGS
jgi:hypothetical protein